MIFLDTSGILCLHDAGDERHGSAVSSYCLAAHSLTHSYVLAELIPLSQSRGLPRSKTLDYVEDLLGSPTVDVLWVDELLHERAIRLLRKRLDKTYSLCDAVSFVVMRERGIREALTTDTHFGQEGFRRLLDP